MCRGTKPNLSGMIDVDGQCHCGAVKIRASVDPDSVTLCHCPDCQEFTGSPYRAAVPADAERFEIVSGTPARYIKTREDGSRRVHAFCSSCGSPMFSSADEPSPKVYRLRLGTLRQRAGLKPVRQQWCSTAFPWALIPGIPSVEESFAP